MMNVLFQSVFDMIEKGWKFLCHSDGKDFEKIMNDTLVGHSIVSVEEIDNQNADIILDDGTKLRFAGNEGCGGCDRGWYYVKNLAEHCNVITAVRQNVTFNCDSWEDESCYELFVLCEDQEIKLATYEGYDNGYYGTGYSVLIYGN